MATADSATIDVTLRVVDLTDEEFADFGPGALRPSEECPPPDADIAVLEAHAVRMLQIAGAMRGRQAHIEKVIDAVVKRVTESYQLQIDAAEKTKTWALSQLRLATEVLQDRGRFAKAKTCKTPFGAFGIRKTRAKLEVMDEAQALAWLAEHAPTAIREIAPVPARQAVDKTAALPVVIAEGGTAPGMEAKAAVEEFYYVLDGE
jgi:hypothetical protein